MFRWVDAFIIIGMLTIICAILMGLKSIWCCIMNATVMKAANDHDFNYNQQLSKSTELGNKKQNIPIKVTENGLLSILYCIYLFCFTFLFYFVAKNWEYSKV